MFQRLLIKIIIKYLNFGKERDDEKMQRWLADAWEHPGGRAYFATRDATLRDQLAAGIGQKELDHTTYTRWYGQRMEHLILATKARRYSEKYRRERQLTKIE